MTGLIDGGKQAKHSGFGRFLAEPNVMFRGIVETTFGLNEITAIEERFSQLAVCDRQPFFMPNHPMVIERPRKRCDGLIPSTVTGFLLPQIVVEDAESAIVLQFVQEVQCLKIIKPGLVWAVGVDQEIAEIDQRVGDGVLIAFCSLDGQDFAVTSLRTVEVVHHRAGVSQIAQRVGKRASVAVGAVFRHRRFPGLARITQLSAMEKNPRPMCVIIVHASSASTISGDSSCSGGSTRRSSLTKQGRSASVSTLRRVVLVVDQHLVLFLQPQSYPKRGVQFRDSLGVEGGAGLMSRKIRFAEC